MQSTSLNILVITEDDPFFILVFFKEFFQNLDTENMKIAGMVNLKPFGDRTRIKLAKRMYSFYGPVDFFRIGMKYLYKKVMAIICTKMPIRKCNRFFSLKQLCHFYQIPYSEVANINSQEFLHELSKRSLDVIVSVAAPQKFKSPILDLPEWGCINIHSGKLPKYRGMMPNFWNMLNNEKTSAVTVHMMNQELDDGEIILQQEFDIFPQETLHQVIEKTKKMGAHLMLEALEKIRSGTVILQPNPRELATYYSFPTADDVKKFKRMGKKII